MSSPDYHPNKRATRFGSVRSIASPWYKGKRVHREGTGQLSMSMIDGLKRSTHNDDQFQQLQRRMSPFFQALR